MTPARRSLLMLVCALSLAFDWGARLPRLQRDLASGDASTRREAVRELSTLDAATAGPDLLRALSDDDPGVRTEAARGAARLGLPEAAERLTTWLADADQGQRRAAIAALGEIGDEQAVGRLLRALGDTEPEVREEAVRALGRIGHGVPLAPVSSMLEDSEPSVRREAAHVLGLLGDPSALMALAGRVEDSSPEVRAAVVSSLGQFGDPLAVGALSSALGDEDSEVRLQAALALGRIDDPRAVRRLSELSRGTDPRLSQAALASLSAIGGEEAIHALIEALARPSLHASAVTQLRALAAEERVPDTLLSSLAQALDDAGDDRGATAIVDALDALLEDHPSDRPVPALLRALAQQRGREDRLLSALAATGAEDAALPIFSRLEDADERTRAAALDATDRYLARRPGDGRVADPLLHLLSRASGAMGPLPSASSAPEGDARALRRRRIRLLDLLGVVGAPRALPALLAASAAQDPEERFAAVRAIGRLGVAEGAASLMPLLDDHDPRVRFEAAQAIGAGAGPDVVAALLDALTRPGAVDRHARLLALGGALSRPGHPLASSPELVARTRRALLGFGQHADQRIAARALDALARWGDPEALAALAAGPFPRSPTLARSWIGVLAVSAEGADVPPPLDALEAEDPLFAAAAAAGLGEHRGREVVAPLVRTVGEAAFPVDAAASFALARLGRRGLLREEDIPSLCALFSRRHPATRANLMIALASLHASACHEGPDPASVLATARAPQVRAAAARWLFASGREDARALLERAAATELDPQVSLACHAPELPALSAQADVYAYAADAETPQTDSLLALTLADSSVLVAPTDALAHLRLSDAPEGDLSLWDPTSAALEN